MPATWEHGGTGAGDKGEAGVAEGRDKCGSHLLKEAGMSSIKGTAGWSGLKGKERS